MSILIKLALLSCSQIHPFEDMPEMTANSCGLAVKEHYIRADEIKTLTTYYQMYQTYNKKGEEYWEINVPYCRIHTMDGLELNAEESCKSIAKQVK